jgi:hypothetical protein
MRRGFAFLSIFGALAHDRKCVFEYGDGFDVSLCFSGKEGPPMCCRYSSRRSRQNSVPTLVDALGYDNVVCQ